MAVAVNIYGPKGPKRIPQKGKRSERIGYDPIHERAKIVADTMYERAKKIRDVLAPDEPVDAEPLEDWDVYNLLEMVALNLSPHAWDDPDAIADLIRLRKQFAPQLPTEELRPFERLRRTDKRLLPDPAITPQSDEYEKKMKRLGV